jgi:hypothetical protein
MWVHPVVWPADSAAQRRRRAAGLAFVLGLTGWLIGHLAVEVAVLPSSVTHSWTVNCSDVLTLVGLVLVVPLPRLSRRALLALAGKRARKLAAPVVVGALVVLRANLSGAVSPDLRVALQIGWWLVLVLGAVQVCHLVAGLDAELLIPPHPLRLRAGVGVLAAALASAGAIVLFCASSVGASPLSSVALGGLLLALTAWCGWTLRDLHDVPATD